MWQKAEAWVCEELESIGHIVYGSYRFSNIYQIDLISSFQNKIFLHEIKWRKNRGSDINDTWSNKQIARHKRALIHDFSGAKYWLWIGSWNYWKVISILF